MVLFDRFSYGAFVGEVVLQIVLALTKKYGGFWVNRVLLISLIDCISLNDATLQSLNPA